MNETAHHERGRPGRGSAPGGRHAAKPRLARTLAVLSALTLAAGGAMVALAGPASAAKPAPQGDGSYSDPYVQHQGIPICHRTNSNTNPYVSESPDFDSIVKKNGHSSHTGGVWDTSMKDSKVKWGDIIPSFWYQTNKTTKVFYPGLNWNDSGKEILGNGCSVPEGNGGDPEPSNPALELVKTAEPTTYAVAGSVITYTYVVKNIGHVPVSNPTISETLFTGSGTVPSAVCADTVVEIGDSTTCVAQYTVVASDLYSDEIINVAEASARAGDDTVTSNKSNAVVTNTGIGGEQPQGSPHLTLTKTASPTTYSEAGQTITYSFLVTNDGEVTIDDLAINEVDFTGSGILSDSDCQDSSLDPAESTTCSATYVTTSDDVAAGSVTNTATASGYAGDDPVESDPSSATVRYRSGGDDQTGGDNPGNTGNDAQQGNGVDAVTPTVIQVLGTSQAVAPKPVAKPVEVKGVSQNVPAAPSANAHTGQGQSPWVYVLFGLGALLMLGAVRARRSGRA